jgi:hypothetical protein
MSRGKLSILVMLVVIVLFGVATTTASNAETDQLPWPGTFICAEGTLTVTATSPSDVTLAGSVQPCPGTWPTLVAGARWGIARYHETNAVVWARQARRFTSTSGPTVFEARVLRLWYLEQGMGPLQAACLITGAWARHACVKITMDSDGMLHAEPIPVTDPIVSRMVEVITGDGPDPECGACV